jgi:hypothetical protein
MTFKHQSFFFHGVFSIINLCIPKLMKIIWFFFFGSFAHHFQMKLSTYGSNLNSISVIMSDLEFFLLTRVLTHNLSIVDLVKFLDKSQNYVSQGILGVKLTFLV